MIYDVAVIGMGPAGITCSIQLKRYGIKLIAFESNEIGGLLRNANLIENYPGFPNGISGQKLCTLMKRQVQNFGIKPIFEEVQEIRHENDLFHIITSSHGYKCRFVVIATGTKPNVLKDVDIDDSAQKHIYYEVQDMPQIENKSVIIIGSGDASFDYALRLANSNDVEILCRNDHIKSLRILYDRALSNDKIQLTKSIKAKSIYRKNNRLLLNCELQETSVTKMCDEVLIAIGRSPNNIRMDDPMEKKYSELIGKSIFEIGDIKNGIYRQATISCGEGMRTAMMINDLLRV
jgi:thioredoxin reductase (NADPH)